MLAILVAHGGYLGGSCGPFWWVMSVMLVILAAHIGHVGYLLIGFSCSTLSGVQGILVYTMVYVVTSLLVWG